MLACGVDVVEVARIERTLERFGTRFLDRVYTVPEQERCAGRATSLAARWAGKEAVAKTLGCGIGQVAWRDIEILGDERGAPTLELRGDAARLAERRGLTEWAISLTHEHDRAIAFVVASG